MESDLTVGIIILTLNGSRFISPLARSIFAQTHPVNKIVVVDNGSDDDTVDMIKEHFLPLGSNIVLNEKNTGCARGYNQGAKHCWDLDIVIFLNQDVILDSKYLESVLYSFRSLDIVAVQPLVLYYDRPDVIENCGHSCDMWMSTQTIAHKILVDLASLPSGGALFTLTAPAIRTGAFRKEDGFDEHLFVYYEDTDLSLRLLRRGGRIAFAPNAIVYHDTESASKLFPSAWKRFLWTRNRLLVLWRHSSGIAGALRSTAAILILLAYGSYLVVIDPAEGIAILRGVVAALRDVKRILLQRRKDKKIYGFRLSELGGSGAISDGISIRSFLTILRSNSV